MLKSRRKRHAPAIALALWGLLITGCGDGKPSTDTSLTEATVSGVVTVKGTPAAGGEIHFNPSNYGRIVPPRTAPIGPDGKYTIKTYTGDNVVTFGGEVASKNRGVGLIKEGTIVQSGENEINFDLMGAGAKNVTYDLSKAAKKKGR
ncbi:hypothetical protein OJF2_27980 [Aquisphaera giovannonii]|uniref:Lipoprotein n=1 Tax=Aquisphaera giovannonii TaxID=406548 RepID=A0A5B9W138_9BACT|nr:hypothetical protein [Aquisphaera giovannonii]QEH34263.1 hypothetical protein OJF2_27980 [Aquisphaera giovannonii]